MSDANAQSAIRSKVIGTLSRYDQSRDPALLRDASDQVSQQDGSAPPDPEQARRIGQDRIALWLEVFSRFKRDLDPGFDPDNAPTLRVMPPLVGNMQLPPGVPPSSIPDPELRRKYEQDIAGNRDRIRDFAAQNKLHEAHVAVLERAAESIRDAHATLGLSGQEIRSALAKGDVLPGDRNALFQAAQP